MLKTVIQDLAEHNAAPKVHKPKKLRKFVLDWQSTPVAFTGKLAQFPDATVD